jgi:hypothetical protein
MLIKDEVVPNDTVEVDVDRNRVNIGVLQKVKKD